MYVNMTYYYSISKVRYMPELVLHRLLYQLYQYQLLAILHNVYQ